MTLLADPTVPPLEGTRCPKWPRMWRAPAWAHLAGLTAVLVLLVPVVGTSSSFLADEGAAVIQGRSLAAGRGWIVTQPAARFDPGGDYYPVVNAERGTRGFAPLAKHPAYALLVAAAARLGGVAPMVLLSVIGTVLAAGLGAALAGRLDPALTRPTIWAVGLASPLLFDGFLVMAHSLAAALAAAAMLVAVVAISDRRPLMALGVAPCVAGAVLLRNEALLFSAALALVATAMGLRRAYRLPAMAVAMSALVGAGAAHLVELAGVGRIVGRSIPISGVPVPVVAGGFLRARLDGFVITWLVPGYGASPALGLLLLATVAALGVAALAVRSAPAGRARVLVPAFVAAAAAVASLAVAPTNIVPGLLLAFPMMTPALLLLRRSLFDGPGPRLAMATAGLFALAVIATQYATGGTGEWGGRYFALAIPIVVPVLLLGLYRQGQTLDPLLRKGCATTLIVCSLALFAIAVLGLRANHQQKLRLVDSIEAGEAVAGAGAPVVTTWSAAPRFAWSSFDRIAWLRVDTAGIRRLRRQLVDRGVDRFVFVTANLADDRAQLAGLNVLWAEEPTGRGRAVLVVQEAGSPRRPTTPE